MSERDAVGAILERVERPVAPDETFAGALLDDLLEELGNGRGPRRRRGGKPRLSTGKALTIAASFLVAAVGLAALQPFARRAGVPASVGELGPFPLVSFQGTVVAGPVDLTSSTPIGDVTYASQFSWKVTARGDYLSSWGNEVGAVARDGDVLTLYDIRTNTTRTLSERSAGIAPDFSPARLLTWNGTKAFSWAKACAAGRIVGEEEVRGGVTARVRCPNVTLGFSPRGDVDVWVDPSSGIVLRIETAPKGASTDDLSLLGPFAGQRWELVDVQVGGVSSAAYRPPPGAIDATDQTVLTSVRLGDPMPLVELPLLTGGTTTLSGTPGGPSAIYFWDGSCYGKDCSMLTLTQALASRTDIDVVVVAGPSWTENEIRREIRPEDVSVPIAVDPDGVAYGLVGRYASNTLFLLSPDGSLEAVYEGNYGGQLDDILDAFVAGEPLPAPGNQQTQAQLP